MNGGLRAAVLVLLCVIGATPNVRAQTPAPGPSFPPCEEAAFESSPGLNVFRERHDDERYLQTLIADAKNADACSEQYVGLEPNYVSAIVSLAAARWAKVADIAYQLRKYGLAREAVAASNRLYEKDVTLRSSFEASDIANDKAEVIANNDLLSKLPH